MAIPELPLLNFYYDSHLTKWDTERNMNVHVPLIEQQVIWLVNQHQQMIQQLNMWSGQTQMEINNQVANATACLQAEVEKIKVERDLFQRQTEELLKIWKEEWKLSMEDSIDLLYSFAQLRELLLKHSPSPEFMECWEHDQSVTSLPQMVRDFIIETGDK